MINAEGIVIKKTEEERIVSIGDLFRFADVIDGFLIFFGIICSAGTGSISPAFAYIFGSFIDAYNETQAEMKTKIAKLAITLVVLGVISAILNFGHRLFWTVTGERQMKRLREAYLKAVLRQEIAWFDTIGIGQIVTRISGDTILIQNGIGQTCGTIIQTTAVIVLGLVVGFIRGWELTLVVLAATPALTFGSVFVMKMTQVLTKKGLQEYATAGNTAEEILSGIRTVTAFGGQKRAIAEYTKQLEAAEKFGVKQSFYSGLSFGFTFLAMYCAFGLSFWYGGRLVAHGHGYTGGKILSVMWSSIGSAAALPHFGNNLEEIGKARSAASAIYATIDRKISAALYSFADQEEEVNVKGAVEFVDVHFSYPTRQEVKVLNGLNISVKSGQKVALVGKSGCGKSSTIALLQRFYEPSEGCILLDGKDIKSINLKSLRRQFGYVGQEPVLFSGTISDNIAFGLNMTQEQIEEAAKASNAHNFISEFPQGYQTQVGQRGTQLSGGQKQRIAIARAIVRNPKILLLDEATSALDTESEGIVQEALDRVMKGRTTIVIAHRLSTIKDADVIFVVNGGEVAESGTHEELMAKEGIYKEMVKRQSKPEEEEHEDNENQHLAMKHESNFTKKMRTSSVTVQGTKTTDKEEKEQKEKQYGALEVMKRLLILNKPELLFLVIGVLAAAATGGISPLYAVIYSKAVVAYYKPVDDVEDELRPWVLALVGLGLAAFIVFFFQNFLLRYAGEKLTTRLRGLSFRSLLVQDIAWFDRKENSSGALAHMLASDASQLHGMLGPRIARVVTLIVTLLVALGIALYHSWKLTLVILSTVPLLIFANAVSVIVMKGFADKTRQRVAEANHLASEAVQNVRTVYAFTNEENILKSFSNHLEIPKKYGIRSGFITACMAAISQLFTYPSFALGVWYGGYLLYHNQLTFSDLMIVNMTIFQCAMSMGANAAMGQISVAKAAVDGILRILDMKPTILVEGGKIIDAEKCSGEITLKSVQFFYPSRPETKLFRGLDLTVPTGKVVALVGPSGSGKSSIVGLVERFYDPQAGTVLLGGEDITQMDADSLRSQIGLVGQEPVLFSGTIAENIAFGKPNATQEEIEEAAKASNAHNFISEFPQGYQTQVGQRGTQLSGGQKQRIAIARAIVRNPKILLLDEATSALDTESERVVQEALDRVMKGRTTIVVAHKLATIRDADVIFVIDKGRIVESGTHDELWELGGVYHKLVARQM